MRRFKGLIAAVVVAVAVPATQAIAAGDEIVDLAINGLPLLSPDQTGPILTDADGAVIHAAASTLYRFANADGSQELTLTVHPGAVRYSVSVASVRYRRDALARPVLAGQPDAFVSRKGIRLGMARDEVESLIGEPDEVIGDTAVYELVGESSILRRFSMPIYRATYAYEDDRLIGFRFGFPYP